MAVIEVKQNNKAFKAQMQWAKALQRHQMYATQLTEAMCNGICEKIQQGATLEQAAYAMGINPATVHNWVAKAELALKSQQECDPLVLAFVTNIKQVEAQKQLEVLQHILLSAEGGQLIAEDSVKKPDGTIITKKKYSGKNWQAAAWFLQYKFPEIYGSATEKIAIEKHVLNNENDQVDEKILQILQPAYKVE